jgi:hypothetical protein
VHLLPLAKSHVSCRGRRRDMTAPPCRVTPYATMTAHGKNLSKKISDGSLTDKPISSAVKPLKRMCSNEGKPSIVEVSMDNPSSLIFEQLRANGTSTANVRSDVMKCAGAGLRTSVDGGPYQCYFFNILIIEVHRMSMGQSQRGDVVVPEQWSHSVKVDSIVLSTTGSEWSGLIREDSERFSRL